MHHRYLPTKVYRYVVEDEFVVVYKRAFTITIRSLTVLVYAIQNEEVVMNPK